MRKELFFAFSAAASIAASAAQCPLGDAITGKGIGRSLSEASSNADISIAENINSSLRISSTDFFSQVEVNGVPADSSNFLQIAAGRSFLENREAVRELKAPYKDEHGNIVAQRYICKSDAAKPYLNSMRERAGRLKNAVLAISGKSGKKEAWENVVSIYKTLKDLEGVLKNLGQASHALQREYEADYARAYREYKAFAEQSGKGVFVESSDAFLKSRIGFYLSRHGCALADEPGNSALHLKLQVSEEQQADAVMNVVYCTPSVYAILGDNKTGKGIYEDKINVAKVGHVDMRKACEQALDEGLPKIWAAFQGKIQKEHCK